jgi:hypothetical protein
MDTICCFQYCPEFAVSREADADIHAVCPETYWYFLSVLVDAHGYTFKNKLKR